MQIWHFWPTVGLGQVKPVEAKVEAISDFSLPLCKTQLVRFLGMAGYYRKFCYNFSIIAEPLTNLLGKRVKFIWTYNCQKSFEKLKAILKSDPVPLAPSFDKEFKLAVVMLVQVVCCYKKITMMLIILFVTNLKRFTNIKEITLP